MAHKKGAPYRKDKVTCYKISYTRTDMPNECGAIKHANTKEEALKHLAVGNKTKGYKLKRSNVSIIILNIEEIKDA